MGLFVVKFWKETANLIKVNDDLITSSTEKIGPKM